MLDQVEVSVAAIPVCMGKDKSRVRFIVHYSPPDSREGAIQQSANVPAGEPARRDVSALSQNLGIAPQVLEQRLLAWAEHGLLSFRGERRDAVVERLRPPEDAAGAINHLLEEQDRAQQRQV